MAKRDLRNSLNVGDRFEVTIDNVAHGGVFVARTEQGVLFVPDVIPGERVIVQVSSVSKSFANAEPVEIVEASADRVEHFWPEARFERSQDTRAGGAEFGHIRFAAQRQLKATVLRDAMQRIGGVDTKTKVQAAPGDAQRGGLGWRRRVRLHVSETGRQGPFAARTHTVVPVQSIPLASEAIQRDALLEERLVGATSVEYVEHGDGIVEILATEGGRPEGKTETITEYVGEREFQLDRAGFWQVHREAPALLTAAVQRAIDTDLADPKAANLDLYGGVGLLAAAVAELLGSTTRIVSVETDEIATDHASENLAEWLGAQAITAPVASFLADARQRATPNELARYAAATVVLDPPRAGAGKQVIASLGALSPAQIVYVACDPVALARDTALLREHGYELASLEAFDIFPHTHHFESVAAFRKA